MLTNEEIAAAIQSGREMRAKMTDEEWEAFVEPSRDFMDRMNWEHGIGRDKDGREFYCDEDGNHWYEDEDERRFRIGDDGEKIYK